MGRIQRGWEITKSSWRVLRLDKELIAMPILSGFFSVAVIASIVAIMLASQNYTLSSLADDSFEGTSLGDWEYVILIGAYLIVTFIVNFFGAAIIYGAIERFRGNDPTIRSSIAAAKRHLLPGL